jgi:hypothetical protein
MVKQIKFYTILEAEQIDFGTSRMLKNFKIGNYTNLHTPNSEEEIVPLRGDHVLFSIIYNCKK